MPTEQRRGWPANRYEALSMDRSDGHPLLVRAKNLPPSRWREFLAFLVADFAWYWLHSLIEINHQVVPAGNASAVNSYPVHLGSQWCTATELAECPVGSTLNGLDVADAAPTVSDAPYCCGQLAAGTGPGETVSTLFLAFIVAVVPVIVILLRYAGVLMGAPHGACSAFDAFLGFMSTTSVVTVATVVIKTMVGRPRPNYFALREMELRSGFPRFSTANFADERIKSFPSGHSSTSMASMAYITLLLLGDITSSRWLSGPNPTARLYRTALAYLSLLPVAVSLWVGVTRIRDYWHFQDDVLAGWCIGLLSACFGYYWVAAVPQLPPAAAAVAVNGKMESADGAAAGTGVYQGLGAEDV